MVKNVLFINNARTLLAISGLLARMGYEVDLYHDVNAGLERLEKQAYDIIVLMEIPTTESWPTCERIRALTGAPLIVISPDATAENCVRAINAGADCFLRKSFGPMEFLARVSSLLQRNAARQPLPSA